MKERSARAGGKVILLGEHAVVHGCPALAVGIDRGASATAREIVGAPKFALGGNNQETGDVARAFRALLEAAGVADGVSLEASSELPPGGGLGSSAAIGVATARALFALVGRDGDVEAAALAFERVFHGNPSGIDVAAAARGGVIRFVRGEGSRACVLGAALPLLVGLTGRGASTKAMVERVAAAPGLRRFVSESAARVARAEEHLASSDFARLGEDMNECQALLAEVGVSTPEIERLVVAARSAGALGAKLTGAGGGGAVIALAPDGEEAVLEAWRAAGAECFRVSSGAAPSG